MTSIPESVFAITIDQAVDRIQSAFAPLSPGAAPPRYNRYAEQQNEHNG